jgi:hypothetical protein
MKNLMKFAFIGIIVLTVVSCQKISDCAGTGTLTVENTSSNTAQKLMINGVSYGTIYPGDSKSVKLSPGVYTWQLVGVSGGTGCSAATLNVSECMTYSYTCDGK